MLAWLYKALGTMLYWFSEATGGYYVLGLLFYALIFKVIFLPFAVKQQKNQIKMAKLTPKIELIKAKYRGRTDAVTMQKQREEIMQLQQESGYSMASGCLPLLIQFPVIIFLYNVIRNPLSYICQVPAEKLAELKTLLGAADKVQEIELVSMITNHGGIDLVGNFGAVRNLPDFTFFGIGNASLAATPSLTAISILVAIPFLAAFFQWLTMFLTRKWNGNSNQLAANDPQAGCSTKMLDITMPLMTLFFTFNFSAMLGVYWIYQSLISILQIFIISRVMPMPTYTEEEIKAFKKAQKEQEKLQKAALKNQPKTRSLHYIDEDDYDELPEVKPQKDTTVADKLNGSDRPEIKD